VAITKQHSKIVGLPFSLFFFFFFFFPVFAKKIFKAKLLQMQLLFLFLEEKMFQQEILRIKVLQYGLVDNFGTQTNLIVFVITYITKTSNFQIGEITYYLDKGRLIDNLYVYYLMFSNSSFISIS
jgi:hypothetical protein